MTLEFVAFPDEEWAAQTAERFAAFVAGRPTARIVVPTGATVEPFYAKAAPLVAWDRVMLFLLDEFGGLPADDPGRCSSMIDRYLLSRLEHRPPVHGPDIDAEDLDAECGRYRSVLSEGVDLVMLGLGTNGHVGMNEPGSTADTPTRVVRLDHTTTIHAVEYGVTRLPTWGITVGFAEILSAREVWLLVTGQHKREILKRTLHDAIGSDVPATQLRLHPRLTVLADYSAAGTELMER